MTHSVLLPNLISQIKKNSSGSESLSVTLVLIPLSELSTPSHVPTALYLGFYYMRFLSIWPVF